MNFRRLLMVCVLAVCVPAYAADKPAKTTIKWVGCGISKKAFMNEMAKAYEKKTGIKFDIQGGGATKGIRKAVTGEADIGGSCRHTIDGHNAEIGAILEPVAWDALAVIVHPDNPVEDISFEQVRGIYLGKITNWKELGGNDAPIRLMARKGKSSGVGRTIRKLVFANYDQVFKASDFVKSSGPLEKTIEKDVNAIGITGISSARKRQVKSIKLDGKKPSYDNIRSGAYGLYRPLYLVVNSKNKKRQEINDFLAFVHSAEGKDVMRKNGTVPYLDALKLIMKELEQEERAQSRGLYR